MKHSVSTLFLFVLIAFSQAPNTVAAGDAEILSLSCNGCHGPEGVSYGPSIPSVAGLNFRYFMRTMLRFKKGERASTIMGRIAKGYTVSELRKISRYFAALEWGKAATDFDSDKVRKGRKIHEELCEECHEKNGRHQDKDIPRMSGQTPNYLYLQMLDYQTGMSAMPQPDKMKERLDTLTAEDLEAIGEFYGSGT